MVSHSRQSFLLIRIIIILLATYRCVFAIDSQPPAAESFESARFVVEAPRKGMSLTYYSEICEKALDRLAPSFDLRRVGGGKIRVWVSPDERDFERATGLRGERILAVAFPDEGAMVLNAGPLKRAGANERFRTVGHEMVHLLLGRVANHEAFVPKWLHEGLAQLVTGQGAELDNSVRLAWHSLRGDELPMRRLSTSFPYGGELSDLAYAESASFTSFVAHKELRFNDANAFFQNLLRDPEKAKTIFARLSDPRVVDDMESRWRRQKGKSQDWLLVVTSNFVIWGTVAVLFIVAYWRKRRREKAVMEDWDPWEREADPQEAEQDVPEYDVEEDEDEKWRDRD